MGVNLFNDPAIGVIDFNDPQLQQQSYWICYSYQTITGQALLAEVDVVEPSSRLARALFLAPFAVLSHDVVEHAKGRDNFYNYANLNALKVFERSWAEQMNLASSQSAQPMQTSQVTRNNYLAQCLAQGQVTFDAQRVTGRGRLVQLRDLQLFNLFDPRGIYRGQAVRIPCESVRYLDELAE